MALIYEPSPIHGRNTCGIEHSTESLYHTSRPNSAASLADKLQWLLKTFWRMHFDFVRIKFTTTFDILLLIMPLSYRLYLSF